jgi:prepilin-type processing-associated H-X9-DG protein
LGRCPGIEKVGGVVVESVAQCLMKKCNSSITERAFTLVEVLVVIITIALLIFIVLPIFTVRSHGGRGDIVCRSNLKQVGLAMRMFSNEHDGRFPWAASKSEGGSMDYVKSTEIFRHFLSVTNELGSARILTCPYDLVRLKASDWNAFTNNNLSYFAGLDATEDKANSILSGDRTLSLDGTNALGVIAIRTNTTLRIAGSFHEGGVNLAFGDGSAQQVTEKQVRRLVFLTNDLPMRLAVP